MGDPPVTGLMAGLSLEKRRQLAAPRAEAYVAAFRNAGFAELREIAKDQLKSTVIGYLGFAGAIYELAESVAEDGIGETLKGKLVDHFLEFTGLEHFKSAYEILEKLDNGRAAMALMKDIRFKEVIGKLD